MLMVANIPFQATIEITEDLPEVFSSTNQGVVLFCGFLMGLTDAGIKTVVFTTISSVWESDTAPGYALHNAIAGCLV